MGKTIRRTPDELLRDAVAGDMDLPGKGKALDLSAYFQPDAEHRLADSDNLQGSKCRLF